jgi:polysaccharide biosynthesis transport protein
MSQEFGMPDPMGVPAEDTDLSFVELGQMLRRQWHVALAVATLVFAGISFSTLSKTPQYQSQTLILLDSEKSAPPIAGLQETGLTDTPKDLSTEIQILRSYALVASALNPDEAGNNPSLPPAKNPTPSEKIRETAFGDLSVSEAIENLAIRQAGDADVLIVSYTDTDPQRAKTVLEVLGRTYVDYSLERQRSQATNAIGFIKEQLPKAQTELNEAAIAVREFRERYGIVDPDTYAQDVGTLQQSLTQQAQEASVALTRTQRQYEELRRQVESVGQNPNVVLKEAVLGEDTVYQSLVQQLQELDAKYQLERTRLQDAHPVMEDLRLQRDRMQQLVRDRTERVLGNATTSTDLEGVSGSGETQKNLADLLLTAETELAAQTSQLDTIRQQEAAVADSFQQIPQLQQTYTDLQRQLEVKSQSVKQFLERQQELEIVEAKEIAPWQILEPPYLPTVPIAPNVKRGLVLGGIAGVLAGVGTAWMLEQLDRRVKRVEEVKNLTRLPLLGTVPKIKQFDASFPNAGYAAFTESLRSLAMNLRYLVAEDGRMKVLLLTSATPGEGKTTVTYYLGRVLAELGLRVLLVDADLRKPTLHQIAEYPNAAGLSTAIATDRSWRELVRTGDIDGLDILTAGPTPPNPVALLDSLKMKQLLGEWRRVYDYVLLDTPPIGAFADAQSLGSRADSTIWIVGMGRATRGLLRQTLEVLKRGNLAGFVANLANKSHGDSTYFDYGSYYPPSHQNGSKSPLAIDREIRKL